MEPSAMGHQPSVPRRSFLNLGFLRPSSVKFKDQEQVDFVIVGSGAAGGIMAKELSTAGFSIVVLEQGPYLRERDFHHDEFGVTFRSALTHDPRRQPNTARKTSSEKAHAEQAV